MKSVRGLIVMVCMLGAASCFNPPEYSVIPEIKYESIKFIETPDPADTLALTLRFKDGDGDIGLSDADNTDGKYADRYFFKLNDNQPYYTTDLLHQKLVDNPQFIRYKTKRTVHNYDTLPNFSCANWEIVYQTVNNVTAPVDTLYFKMNPNNYNVFVDFLVKQPNGTWVEFDFRKEFQCQTYDGRVPILSKDLSQSTPLEGTIRYAMTGVGFKFIFTLKLLS